MKRLLSVVLLSILVFTWAGCTHREGGIATLVNSSEYKRLKKVAVLPFNNISGRKDAGKIVADIYVAELFKSGKYRVEEPGNIKQFLIQERITTIGEMEIERLKVLGRRLKVDAVVAGTVEEFDDGRGGVPVVSISARMVDSKTGRILWYERIKRRGDDYIIIFDIGLVRSATSLAKKIAKEMIDRIE
ncbi:MAG TPA: hypothetical protein ENK42_02165 [Deltaproteobacteria bacterium]|nr:hypothetical protein [Deltaproteobacteria bacterium]